VSGPPPAFLALDFFELDSNQMTGASDAIYRSNDGGLTWSSPGPTPGAVADLAISARYADTLFSGTTGGLVLARMAAMRGHLPCPKAAQPAWCRPWRMAGYSSLSSAKAFTSRGDSGETWTLMAVAEAIDGALLHLVGDFGGSLFAVTQFMKVFTSDDGGRT